MSILENYICEGQISMFEVEENHTPPLEKSQNTDIRIFNDDCMNILKTLKSESVDLVVTDCPYHIVSGGCTNDATKIGSYKNGVPGGILNHYKKDANGNKFYTDTKHISLCGILNDYDPTMYVREGKLFKHNDIKFKEWLPEIYRVLKQNTHCYIMINPRNLKELQEECEKVGFIFQNIIIWDKGNGVPNKYYMNAYEMILMLRKGKAKNINNMGTKNILRVPNIIGNKKHPTEKPVELMQVLIENSCNEGDLVLEPFMGAGASGVACVKTNRRFIGIEIDEKYYNISLERIHKTINEMKSYEKYGYNPYQE